MPPTPVAAPCLGAMNEGWLWLSILNTAASLPVALVAAVERGLATDGGPILLVETSDCCGGGAAGDAVATLKALIDADLAVLKRRFKEGLEHA